MLLLVDWNTNSKSTSNCNFVVVFAYKSNLHASITATVHVFLALYRSVRCCVFNLIVNYPTIIITLHHRYCKNAKMHTFKYTDQSLFSREYGILVHIAVTVK